MKKILVTGGAGFIGSHTVVELVHAGYEPIIVDNFSNTDERIMKGLEKILGESPRLYKMDCAEQKLLQEVFDIEQPQAVIHFAAYKAVGESVENPLKYYHNNIASLITLLQVMQRSEVSHLVFSSSCTIYGQPQVLPVKESSPQQSATSPYGYTKQVSEKIIEDVHVSQPSFGAAILRYFNPIGAHTSGLIGELPNGVPNNLVPYITQTAAGLRQKLTVFGNDYDTLDGTCIRDFIHVSDLARAHVKALNWLELNAGTCDHFNLGQGKGNSVLEVIHSFVKVTGQNLNFEIGTRRNGDVAQVWADVSKANKILNWRTELSLDQALVDAWRWENYLSSSKY